MSNALVVDAKDTKAHHPIAVFGPQVSYYSPQILTQEEISTPDYHAEGASFPGTGLVELGRGEDYAWSATSAGSDLIDQRLELICNPDGGTPDRATAPSTATRASACAMKHETFNETASTEPGGDGDPGHGRPHHLPHPPRRRAGLDHRRWRQAGGGRQPALDVQPRRRLGRRLPAVGRAEADPQRDELGEGRGTTSATPSTGSTWTASTSPTTSAARTRSGAKGVEPQPADLGHRRRRVAWLPAGVEARPRDRPEARVLRQLEQQAGTRLLRRRRPVRVRPGLPVADARQPAQAPAGDHPRQADPRRRRQGDGDRGEPGPRRPDGAAAAARPTSRATRSRPASPRCSRCSPSWHADGAHRRKATPRRQAIPAACRGRDHGRARAQPDRGRSSTGCSPADGLNGKGSTAGGYSVFPMGFVDTPNGGGSRHGSSYDGGWEGYMVKTLEQLRGQHPSRSVHAR